MPAILNILFHSAVFGIFALLSLTTIFGLLTSVLALKDGEFLVSLICFGTASLSVGSLAWFMSWASDKALEFFP